MKKLIKWVLIVIVAIVVLSAIFGGNEDKTTQTAVQTPAALTNEGTASDVKFVVDGSKTAPTVGKNQFATVKANGIFKIVDISVTNNQKDAITINTSLFKLIDDQNREFSPSNEAIMAIEVDQKNSFFLKEINPGITMKGSVAFDVPADAKGFKLKARGGITGKEVLLKVD